MKQSSLTIVLTGGGSGGHITPLLSLARALKKQDPDCCLVYIGQKTDITGDNRAVFDYVYQIPAGKFRRYYNESSLRRLTDLKTILLNIRDLFKTAAGTWKSWRLLGKIKPDVAFSKGGYVAVPVGLAAHFRGVPIVTHDSDSVPGLANRILRRWAKVRAVGQPPVPDSGQQYTGIPIDPRIKKVDQKLQADFKHRLGLREDSQVLLVAGASQGSRAVNDLVLQIAPMLLEKYPKLHILHFAGPNNEELVKSAYLELGQSADRIIVHGFSNDFYLYSGAADLIISRAGATSLAEFAVQHKPVIVIASPFLAGGHQLKNADFLEKVEAVENLTDDTEPKELFNRIAELLSNKQRRERLAANLGSVAKPHAATELASVIVKAAS